MPDCALIPPMQGIAGLAGPQARIDLRGQIVGHPRRRGFECPGQRSLELALRNRGFKLGARDAQPGAATRRSRARIGQHVTIRRNRKTNQLVPLAVAAATRVSIFWFVSREGESPRGRLLGRRRSERRISHPLRACGTSVAKYFDFL